ncbi:unnamed protein product [Symbiodinium natans]|uniref:Uncharacterized protein n=1 Tax=Symbiodinium natans TaxID=878477 RepID=A0A812J526_9DINO|nr:unnamed protein product [Symbiodinium natans]
MMQTGPGCAEALCDRGLFRAASALQILGGLGEVFAEGLTGIIGAAEAPSEVDASAGDGAFGGTECVSHVEVFISHTWSSARWPKYLSMCYFLNVTLAVKAAWGSYALGVGVLLILEATVSLWAPSDQAEANVKAHLCDRKYLFLFFTELPVLVFFVFFFFGQHISASCWAPSLWLDKLCVHQTNQSLKAQQVAALPVFVARSARMLVLWDDTYFERLWCNMEMATFAKYAASPEKMEFLPLWLAPWLLSSILLDLLGVTFVCSFQKLNTFQNEAQVQDLAHMGAAFFGGSPHVRQFIHMFFEVFPNFLCYLPVALPTMLSFKRKIQGHRLMLEQMASFDLKKAKCSVEADRPLVEEQVALHFQAEKDFEVIVAGATDPAPERVEAVDPREEAIERFNNYVQGPLRAACLDSIGDEQNVPLHLCYVCFLPMSFYAAVNATPYAYRECTLTFDTMGYSSPYHLVATFSLCWLSTQLLVFPVTFPVLLRMLQLVESLTSSWVLQLVLGFLGSALAYAYTFFCAGTIWGCTVVIMQSYSPTWLVIFFFVFALLVLQAWFFFGKRPKRSCSCRCLEPVGGDDTKPMLGLRCYPEGD